jgi:hypothetical protein
MKRDSYKKYEVLQAEKKVKEIKGFYFHLFLYLVVNLTWVFVLLVSNEMSSYSQYGFWGMGYGQIAMAVFWGIVLLFHWLIVFGKRMSFSKKWENRKIQELLKEEKQYWE